MSNYFYTNISSNTTEQLISDITTLGITSDFTFCITFKDISDYPDGYELKYSLTNLSLTLYLVVDGNNKYLYVISENKTIKFDLIPTTLALVIDSTNSQLLIYADGALLGSIDDTFNLSSNTSYEIINPSGSLMDVRYTELLFFDKLLSDDEAKLASNGFKPNPNVTVSVSDASYIEVTQLEPYFPNITVVCDVAILNILSNDALIKSSLRIKPQTPNIAISVYEPYVNDFGNIIIDADLAEMAITQLDTINIASDYIVQQWTFTNEDGTGTQYDTKGKNPFTVTETEVRNDLPEILTIPKNYLYYKPIWNDNNFDYGSGKPKVIGEAQLENLKSGSKSFSFWIYRPYIAEVNDNTYLLIDGDYVFNVSPSWGDQTTINSNWTLVVVVYDKVASSRYVYIDNQLSSTSSYVEIGNGTFALATTENGATDIKIGIHQITSYSYNLSASDVDAIYNYFYKITLARPNVCELSIQAPYTENWHISLPNDNVISVEQNNVIINNFKNKYIDSTTIKIKIEMLSIKNLAMNYSKLNIVMLHPETIGEAYNDYNTIDLCPLYHDTVYHDATLGETRVRFKTTDFNSLDSKRDLHGSILIAPYNYSYVKRVTKRGEAMQLTDGYINLFGNKAQTHAFTFCITKLPTNYYTLFDINENFNFKIDANLSIILNGNSVPIKNLELNKEYIIKFSAKEGLYINSYKLYNFSDYFDYTTTIDWYSIELNYLGRNFDDTNSDDFNGYFCNYKVYTSNTDYNFYEYTTFKDNVVGSIYHRKLFSNFLFGDSNFSLPKLPELNSVYSVFKTVDIKNVIKIEANIIAFAGVKNTNITLKPYPAVLKVNQNFLKHKLNAYVEIDSIGILLVTSKVKENIFINPKPIIINILNFQCLVNPTDDLKRVVRIDDIYFDNALEINSELEPITNTFEKLKTIDGNSIAFAKPIKQFSKRTELFTQSKNYITYDTIVKLKDIIDFNKHRMYLNDDTYIDFYFDFTKNTFSFSPIYEGSTYYKLYMEIVI